MATKEELENKLAALEGTRRRRSKRTYLLRKGGISVGDATPIAALLVAAVVPRPESPNKQGAFDRFTQGAKDPNENLGQTIYSTGKRVPLLLTGGVVVGGLLASKAIRALKPGGLGFIKQ